MMATGQGGIATRGILDDDDDVPVVDRGAIWRVLTPLFIGLFAYILSYGLLLIVGLLAAVVLMLSFGVPPTNVGLPGLGNSTSATTTAAFMDTLAGTVRLCAFALGILALWPAGLAGYLTWDRLREGR